MRKTIESALQGAALQPLPPDDALPLLECCSDCGVWLVATFCPENSYPFHPVQDCYVHVGKFGYSPLSLKIQLPILLFLIGVTVWIAEEILETTVDVLSGTLNSHKRASVFSGT